MNMTAISTAPLIGWPILGPLLVLAMLPLLFAVLRRARGSLLRLAFGLVLAGVLTNPSLVRERRDPVKDIALVVVDRSQSQSLGDRTARTDAALAHLTTTLQAFPDLETRIIEIGQNSESSGETDLFGPLQQSLADLPRDRLAGVIALTDGEVHDVPAKPADLATLGPVHTLLSGDRHERDRRISIVAAPAYGLVGKTVQATIRIDDTPNIGQATAQVMVSQDGGAPRELTVPVGRDFPVDIKLDHEGHSIVAFDATPVPNELTVENNRVAIVINAVRDRLKVLLVSGEPYPGERTWRNLLKADPSVDLVHFTILRPPEKQNGTPEKELSLIAFPIRELFDVKLREFDLIIFDRYVQRGILPQAYYRNIVQYVQDGGALLDASGPALADPMSLYYSPLGDILPAAPGETIVKQFKPSVTAMGRRHPVTAGLPGDSTTGDPSWGGWFQQLEVTPKSSDPEKAAVVMAGADKKPLLVLSHVGKGRVAELASDQIWLWSRGYQGGGPQAELMRRMAHWLMKEPALEENDLRARVDGNTLTVDRISLVPGGPDVTVTAPSGATQAMKLVAGQAGADTGTTETHETGVYKVTDGKRTAFAIAGSLDAPEFRDVLTTEARMRPVADATGGSIHWLADGPAIEVRRVPTGRAMSGGSWIGLRQNGVYTVSGVEQTPLLRPLLALAAMLGLLLWGWRREGR